MAADTYAVIVDAGSTGTRAHVFSWLAASPSSTLVEQKLALKLKPGLADIAPHQIESYLAPLLTAASAAVPQSSRRSTRIRVLATAGIVNNDQRHHPLKIQRDRPVGRMGIQSHRGDQQQRDERRELGVVSWMSQVYGRWNAW